MREMKRSLVALLALLGPSAILGEAGHADARLLQPAGSITVSDTVLGQTTTYIGATEGGAFDIDDLTDCGIETYRIWIGMSDVEYCDDDDPGGYNWQCPAGSNYGTPTIAQIKADPSIINWTLWGNHINNATYRWRTGKDPSTTFGTMVSNLKSKGIVPVLSLRNRDENDLPAWIANPPTTADDLNEWWQYSFAVAYWFNVVNSYGVTRFEIHNEPDLPGQGWGGTQAEYVQLVETAHDAIKTANDIAGIDTIVHAPVVSNYNSTYISYSLNNADDKIDVVDYHNYDNDPTTSITTVKNYRFQQQPR